MRQCLIRETTIPYWARRRTLGFGFATVRDLVLTVRLGFALALAERRVFDAGPTLGFALGLPTALRLEADAGLTPTPAMALRAALSTAFAVRPKCWYSSIYGAEAPK
jgi:hypothetical protein